MGSGAEGGLSSQPVDPPSISTSTSTSITPPDAEPFDPSTPPRAPPDAVESSRTDSGEGKLGGRNGGEGEVVNSVGAGVDKGDSDLPLASHGGISFGKMLVFIAGVSTLSLSQH